MCKLGVYYSKRKVCTIQNITTSDSIWYGSLICYVNYKEPVMG